MHGDSNMQTECLLSEPLISIVVPVYNVEQCLRRCLDSVLTQTFGNYELICVDDKSTDNSYEILCEYAANDSRIHIIQNANNRGLSYTRNVGLEQTKGKYVLFLDSDDAILPFCLDRAFPAIEGHQADFLMFGVMEKQGEREAPYFEFNTQFCNKVCTGKEFFVELEENAYIPAPVWAKLWSKDFLINQKLSFYEGIYHEDILFTFSALMKAQRVVYIPDVLYDYYRRDGTISRQPATLKHIESMVSIIDEMLKIKASLFLDERLDNAIRRYISYFYVETERRMADYGFEKLSENSSFLDSEKKELYKEIRCLAMQQYFYVPNNKQIDILKSYKHILVYGAGVVGKQIVSELLKKNMTNIDVVVSDVKGNTKFVCGFAVKSISDVSYPKSQCVVVVGVWKRLSEQVKKIIVSAGYENIFEFK